MWSSRTSRPGGPRRTARTGSGTAGCSWPATPRTWSRRTAATAATRACRTRTTWPGSWRSPWAAWPGPGCWIRMTPNGARSGAHRRAGVHQVRRAGGPLPGNGGHAADRGRLLDGDRVPLRLPAVVLEPGSPPRHEHPRESAGRPGARAPHVFLDRDGSRLSTLDLFGRNFVLLAGAEGAAWPAAALAVADRLGAGLDAHVVGGTGLADPGGLLPRGVRDLAVRRRAGAAGRLCGLAGRRRGRRSRRHCPAGAPDAAVPGTWQAMNPESGKRK